MKHYTKAFHTFLVVVGFLLTGIGVNAQTAGTLDPLPVSEAIPVSNGEKVPLKVTYTVGATTPKSVVVTVKLPEGIEYAGSFKKLSGSALGLEFVDQGADLNKTQPKFKIIDANGDGKLSFGQKIVFEVDRVATCKAFKKVEADNSFQFKDEVTAVLTTVDMGGAETPNTITKNSIIYTLKYPSLQINAPAPLQNKQFMELVEREFSVQNTADQPAKNVKLVIDYGTDRFFTGTDATKPKLQIKQGGAYQDIEPESIDGSKAFYTFTGAMLGATGLQNGNKVELKEILYIKKANLVTNYTASWGLDACEEKTVQSEIQTLSGAPNPVPVSVERVGFTNMCNPFRVQTTYKNEKTGGISNALYDVELDWGGYRFQNFTFAWFTDFRVGDAVITGVTGARPKKGLHGQESLKTDPDGPGVGLEDLDGDGYYDDLPAGATVVFSAEFAYDRTQPFPYNCNKGTSNFFYRLSGQTVGGVYQKGKYAYDVFVVRFTQRWTVLNFALLPENIEAGTPFDLSVGIKSFQYFNDLKTDDYRTEFTLTIPEGVTIDPANVKWKKGIKLGEGQEVPAGSVEINGNKLIVVSPDKHDGKPVIYDAVYACQNNEPKTELSFDWEFRRKNADCYWFDNAQLTGSYKVNVIGCNTACAQGIQTGIPATEREDNFLGWKTYKMLEKQERDVISAYDLSKVTYKDEFFIKSESVQHGTATTLGVKLVLQKDTKGVNGIEPLSVDVKIEKQDGTVRVEQSGLTLSADASTATDQVINWNLSSVLPAGGLKDNDKVTITTHYRVNSNDYNRYDTNIAKEYLVYNGTAGAPQYCGTVTPSIMMASSYYTKDGHPVNLEGSDVSSDDKHLSLAGRRFAAQANWYRKEFRPNMRIKKFYIKLPKGKFVLPNDLKYYNTFMPTSDPNRLTELALVNKSTEGEVDIFEYQVPANVGACVLGVSNYFSFYLKGQIQATAGATAGDYRITADADIEDFYYLKDTPGYATNPEYQHKELATYKRLTYSQAPALTLVNNLGTVELSTQQGEWEFTMQNNSLSGAPFTWLALPKPPTGLTITGITQNGTPLTGNDYGSGTIYKLSDDGLAAGAENTYKIAFEYTGCLPLTYDVLSGWDTQGYPDSPEEYPYEKKVLSLKASPLISQVEIGKISGPDDTPKPLCQDLEYQYSILSIYPGNVSKPVFKVVAPAGLVLKNNQMEVEYPAGSGDWQPINAQATNGVFTIKLLDHSVLQGIGYLKGTTEANSVNERRVHIRFKTTTGCAFVSGNNFRVQAAAQNLCDDELNTALEETLPINIEGADASKYQVDTQITWDDPAHLTSADCGVERKLHVVQTVGSGTTSNQAKLEIFIPAGFEYVENSYKKYGQAPLSVQSVENVASGEQKMTLNILGGITTGNGFEYDFAIREKANLNVACGEKTIRILTSDQANLTCNGVVCPDARVQTGTKNFTFDLKKASIELGVDSATAEYKPYGENIMLNYKVTNTADVALASGTPLTLFDDANKNGRYDVGETILGTQAIASEVQQGTPVTGEMTVNSAPANKLCNLVLTILKADGCYCSVSPANVTLAKLGGVAGEDVSLYLDETKTIGLANNPNYTYKWTCPADAAATAYLSDVNVANPSFHYTGTLTANKEIEYKLTVTRPGGCQSFGKVKVKVIFVPVTSITLNETTLNMKGGETFDLQETVKPDNATVKTVTYSSNKPAVASVNPTTGVVTAKTPGTAIITATTQSGGNTATCTVTVAQPTAPTIIPLVNAKDPITGTAEPGATVVVTLPGNVEKTVTADGSGNWSVPNPQNLTTGQKVKAKVVDGAGNESDEVIATVDADAPSIPTINPVNGTDPIKGTADANEKVIVTLPGKAPITVSGVFHSQAQH